MKIYTVEQGSEEWKQLRLGMITGTRLKDVPKADNLSLVDKLIAEKISQTIEEIYQTQAMKWGTDNEPKARRAYEKEKEVSVSQVGFCVSDKYKFLALSPDGLIKEGVKYIKGIEIKCPDTSTHVRYIRQNKLPAEHKYQVLDYFIVCQDIESLDFISYDPRFVIKPLHVITVTRLELAEEIRAIEYELEKFWEKYEKYYNQIIFS